MALLLKHMYAHSKEWSLIKLKNEKNLITVCTYTKKPRFFFFFFVHCTWKLKNSICDFYASNNEKSI